MKGNPTFWGRKTKNAPRSLFLDKDSDREGKNSDAGEDDIKKKNEMIKGRSGLKGLTLRAQEVVREKKNQLPE